MEDTDNLIAEAESLGLSTVGKSRTGKPRPRSANELRKSIVFARSQQAGPPERDAPRPKMRLLMLRGYVPQNAEVLSVDEATGKDSTLLKALKGSIHDFPDAEGKALIRRGIAVRPDEATDNNLIQAGLKTPPQDDDEEF